MEGQRDTGTEGGKEGGRDETALTNFAGERLEHFVCLLDQMRARHEELSLLAFLHLVPGVELEQRILGDL